MKIKYVQRNGSTLAVIGENEALTGVSRIRPGDKFNKGLGLAVAMLKADYGGLSDSQVSKQIERLRADKARMEEDNLTDDEVIVWMRLWHEYRLALRAVEQRRDIKPLAKEEREKTGYGDFSPLMRALERLRKIPSDGQIAENFGLRLIAEMKDKIKEPLAIF